MISSAWNIVWRRKYNGSIAKVTSCLVHRHAYYAMEMILKIRNTVIKHFSSKFLQISHAFGRGCTMIFSRMRVFIIINPLITATAHVDLVFENGSFQHSQCSQDKIILQQTQHVNSGALHQMVTNPQIKAGNNQYQDQSQICDYLTNDRFSVFVHTGSNYYRLFKFNTRHANEGTMFTRLPHFLRL